MQPQDLRRRLDAATLPFRTTGLVNIVSDANRVIMRRFLERMAQEKEALAAE